MEKLCLLLTITSSLHTEKDYRMDKNHTLISEVSKLEDFIKSTLDSSKCAKASDATKSCNIFKNKIKNKLDYRCIALIRCIPATDLEFWKAIRSKEKLNDWFAVEVDLTRKSEQIYDDIASKASKQLEAIKKQKQTDLMLSCLVQSHEKNFLFHGEE